MSIGGQIICKFCGLYLQCVVDENQCGVFCVADGIFGKMQKMRMMQLKYERYQKSAVVAKLARNCHL